MLITSDCLVPLGDSLIVTASTASRTMSSPGRRPQGPFDAIAGSA